MEELDTLERRQLISAVIELVNLTLDPSVERYVAPVTNDITADINAITVKLRYQPLMILDLNWSLCALLRMLLQAPQDMCDAELVSIALAMAKRGYSNDLIVALLAAGHSPDLATAARDILASE